MPAADVTDMDNTTSASEQMRRMANDQFSKANALHARAVEDQAGIGFDDAGVAWLDRFLNDERDSGDEGRFNSAYWLGGAFFGECMLARWEAIGRCSMK